MSYSLGIDIGGTFTDLVLLAPDGSSPGSLKVLTTHADPVAGILEGTRRLLEQCGVPPASIARVVHATTLFTNALIERKGARTGLLTTAGFRDVLEIGRERKYELYDLFITITDADGKPVDQATVFLDLTMPAMYMPPQQPIAEALGNGRYRVSTLFTMEGEWHVQAHAIINGSTQTVTFNQNVAYQE